MSFTGSKSWLSASLSVDFKSHVCDAVKRKINLVNSGRSFEWIDEIFAKVDDVD